MQRLRCGNCGCKTAEVFCKSSESVEELSSLTLKCTGCGSHMVFSIPAPKLHQEMVDDGAWCKLNPREDD